MKLRKILGVFILGFSVTVIALISLKNGILPERLQIESIPALGSAREAFEKGYADGVIIIKPGVSKVTLGKPTVVDLLITYERREPAPEVIELVFDPRIVVIEIPTLEPLPNGTIIKSYLKVNDYVTYEPKVVRVEEGKTARAKVIIEFPEDFPINLVRNVGLYEIPVPIGYHIPANEIQGRKYKPIDAMILDIIPPGEAIGPVLSVAGGNPKPSGYVY